MRRFDITDDGIDEEFQPTVVTTTTANPLDALRDKITEQVVKPDLELDVLTRDGMSIRYTTNLDLDVINKWRRVCQDKSQVDNFNMLKFASLVVANTAIAFALNGVEPTGADGDLVSFRSPEVLEWTNTKRALDAVRKLFANDAHIIATAQEIMSEAGFGDEMKESGEESPTRRS
jgi:hypothetical protein